MTSRVYLDHAATTPVRPGVVEAMLPFYSGTFGNPSGAHAEARIARTAIEEARDSIANDLGVEPAEVVFTSGATESNNLFVRGSNEALGKRIICSAIEHEAILKPVARVGGGSFGVDADGRVNLDQLKASLDQSVSAVSVMAVNNETGMIQPIGEVVELIKRTAPKVLLHVDAVQAVPWLDTKELLQGVDSFSVSAHKFGGPKGIGVLIVRKNVKLTSQLLGGGQEQDRRSGTHNVAGIVGMATALRECVQSRTETSARVGVLRDRLVDGLLNKIDGTYETGTREEKVASNAHLVISGIESEALVFALDEAGIAASAASACASGAMQPSHVLVAMGYSHDDARSSLRLTLGWNSSEDDIDFAIGTISDVVTKLRGQ